VNKIAGDSARNRALEVYFSTEEGARKENERQLVGAAEALRREFESAFVPLNKTVYHQDVDHKVFSVNADDLAKYLRKLGELADKFGADGQGIPSSEIFCQLKFLEVEGHLRLAKARLPAMYLHSVVFQGEADFTGTLFLGNFAASGVVFSGDVYFNNARFSGGATFDSSAFNGHVYFSGAQILGLALFWRSVFRGDAYFIDVSFPNGVDFLNSEFQGRAQFHRVSIQSFGKFDEVQFTDVADFESAQFSGLSFRKAEFSALSNFQGVRFRDGADFGGTVFRGVANYESAVFGRAAKFLDCKFENQTIFSRAEFEICPRFHGAALHQDTTFTGAHFASTALTARLRTQLCVSRRIGKKLQTRVTGKQLSNDGSRVNWDAEARGYRTLKLHMSKLQSQHEATRFFAGEMRSRRRAFGLKHPAHYVVSWLYDLFSEFGQSVGRVLLWFVLVNGIFTYGYYARAQEDAHALQPGFALVHQINEGGLGGAWDETRPWLALSLQSLNPVAFLSPKNTWVRVHDGTVYLAAAGQSVMNLTLIILLGISLRGQFRRGAGGGD